ncbi:MAG: cation-translocating P-type ATPase [Bacteroidales bacterium]
MTQDNINQKSPFHSYSVDEAMQRLKTERKGLDSEDAKKREEKYGPNKLPEKKQTNILDLIVKQFKDFLVLILVIAAIISWLSGSMVDVYVIIGVILVNATIGFLQEYRAEKAVDALKKMIKLETVVLRSGEPQTIRASRLVPGDIIELIEGDSVPADARIIEQKNMQVEESSLTGESVPVGKTSDSLEKETSLPDRKNMLFKGTHVARGSGKAVVTAIGENTQLGKIAESLQDVEQKRSEYRKKTARLAKVMAGIAISTASIVFVLGYFVRDFTFEDVLLVTIATLVSSVPEGLPAVLSIVLAIGANRMAKQNAIIREFTATETAGSLNMIISDKTGTITTSILTVKKMLLPDGTEYDVTGDGYQVKGAIKKGKKNVRIEENKNLSKALSIAAHCHDASVKQSPEKKDVNPDVSGDPTEVALLVLAKKSKINETDDYGSLKKTDDLPFNSEQKFRASLLEDQHGNKEMVFTGAPEKILDISSEYLDGEQTKKMTGEKSEEIKEHIAELSRQAMRVIAAAYKPAEKEQEEVNVEDADQLAFVGLFGIIDPERPEVKQAIEECKAAGIRVIMATGDHKETAEAIARKVGIIQPRDEETSDCPVALEEKELDVDDETLLKYLECTNVFARVSPETKLRIAKALQNKDALIGMTGDGVNDAPTLKAADVGMAMGQQGTDVARDAAEIVLSDDNFASIVNAVREGRIVFRNMRQASFFLVTTNFASTCTLITALAIGFNYPLIATQILWINLVTDGVMDISLAAEPGHGSMMERKPQKKGDPILNKEIFPYLLIIVPIMVTLAMFVYDYYIPEGIEKARTGVFLVVAMSQVFNAFNMRSLRHSAFKIGFFKNRWLIVAFVASVLLQFAAIKLPFMQQIFHFRDIDWNEILIITALSSLVFVFGELFKYLRKVFTR